MNRIEDSFRSLRACGKKAFIAYITAGDPDIAATKKLVIELERSGVDIIELGVPFSDPIADGPTIQAASQRALENGVTPRKILAMVKSLRRTTQIPIALMTYYNPVLRYGVKDFFRACRHAGVDGVIVPDLPYEESGELVRSGLSENVATIFLVAPTSTGSRVKQIARRSRAFIYYVSMTGVTGARKTLPPDIVGNIRRIKSVTNKPVAVGFGVSNPAQASRLAKAADAVIVGSALVNIVACGGRKDMLSRVSKFARRLAGAIHGA